MILDAQGIIQHSVSYDKEEGEIIHCLSKEQIAELFRLNPDEVVTDDTSVPSFEEPEPEPFDDIDEVILEDITEEEYPKYTSAEDELPTFTEPFDQETEDLLVRYLEEQVEASKAEADDQKKRKDEWAAYWEVLKKHSTKKMPDTHKKVYRTKGYKAGGQILSWAYFHDLGCYAVNRENGIDYFKHPHDFKTLPGFEVNQLARLNMLYSEDSGMSAWFSRQIKYEYRKRWVNFQPQQPERYYLPEIDGDTRKHKVILKWLPPRVLKKIPLRKMRQDFMDGFRWWYYDGRTGEAVIVLCKDKKWETVRIFDPMWLTNLSQKDVQALFRNQIFFDVPDMVQALQFMRVIRLCSIFKIHAGADWKAISAKYFKKEASKTLQCQNPRRSERFLIIQVRFSTRGVRSLLPSCFYSLESPRFLLVSIGKPWNRILHYPRGYRVVFYWIRIVSELPIGSEAAAASEGLVIIDDSSTEELFADEPTGEATGSISFGLNFMEKGKRKLTPEKEAEQEKRRPKMKKGRPDTSLDGEITRLSGLL
ncbi:hypothetical protein E3N88_12395 [Mikania micrantha]|uniref:Uncharacterized protein n=1 Tax=Mikania micrantha TaxID=192012 RepID=A0A5N6P8D2_9ASTR|nr:hypothetical protein E3N88_12395 [Mikania micrantha]